MPGGGAPTLLRARRLWSALSLAGQFLSAGAVTVIVGMALLGVWVTRQIEEGVTTNSAAATALYVDSVIAPLLASLGGSDNLSAGARRALDETLSRGALGDRLDTFKIWKPGGLVVYSNRAQLIGKRFTPTDNLKRAWAGHVAAEYNDLNDAEDALERLDNMPLLEIYSPIREPWSGKVVAVAEFYENATEIEASLRAARRRSWLVVGAVTLGMIGSLSVIVFGGSRLIAAQRRALEQRVSDLSRLLEQNQALRLHVQGASGRAAALNERFLRRVSADLHDGPAQSLALASLQASAIERRADGSESADLAAVRRNLDDAMREIRHISRGLALPQLEAMGLSDVVRSAVQAHEQRTGTNVDYELLEKSPPLVQSEKICVFRFVQEGLNNAFRHAGAAGQRVSVAWVDGDLTVTVADRGPGMPATVDELGGLGLAGLRERVESLGGAFTAESGPQGTHIGMTIRAAMGDKA